jgi:hypothetical protein
MILVIIVEIVPICPQTCHLRHHMVNEDVFVAEKLRVLRTTY